MSAQVQTKAAVSVAEMARMCGLSRSRFYALIGTAFLVAFVMVPSLAGILTLCVLGGGPVQPIAKTASRLRPTKPKPRMPVQRKKPTRIRRQSGLSQE